MTGAHVDQSFALHTRVRRYLIDRYSELTREYSSLPGSGRASDGYHYTDEAKQIFPRYRVVEAILFKVEEFDPDALPPLDELTRLLIDAGSGAQTAFTQHSDDTIQVQAMAEERRLFVERVAQLATETSVAAALPYRRTLTDLEAERWLASLQQRWGIVDRQWFPMLAESVPHDVLVLREEGVFDGGGEAAARAALMEMGVARVIELREFVEHGPHRELDIEWFSPTYTGAEGLWTDGSLDWIAYASHEGTVAFGGTIRSLLEARWERIDDWRWLGWQ